MRKLVVTMFVSLDGIMEDPQWTFKYWNDDTAKFKYDELFASDALLLGRETYEGFASAWPSEKDEEGFADRMNGIAKYVVSSTLQKAEWNNSHIIRANAVEEIRKLKQQDGMDILVGGSAALVQTLVQNDLVDQYNLLIYPVVLGGGKRLFQDGTTATLKLVEAKKFDAVQALVYQPDRKA